MRGQPSGSKIKVRKIGDVTEWVIPKKGTTLGIIACMIITGVLLMVIIAAFIFLRDEIWFPGNEIETLWILIGRIVLFGIPLLFLGVIAYLIYRTAHTSYVVKVNAGAVEVVRKYKNRETTKKVNVGDVYSVCLSGDTRSSCSVQVRVIDGRKIGFFFRGEESEQRWIASEILTILTSKNALADPDDLAKHYLVAESESKGHGEYIEGVMCLRYQYDEHFVLERNTSAEGSSMLVGGIIGFIVGACCLTPEVNVGGGVAMIFIASVIMFVALAVVILGFNRLGTKETFSFENGRILRAKFKKEKSLVRVRYPKSDFNKLEIESGIYNQKKTGYSLLLRGPKDELKLPWLSEQMYQMVQYKLRDWLNPEHKVFINSNEVFSSLVEDEDQSNKNYSPEDILWYSRANIVIDIKRFEKESVGQRVFKYVCVIVCVLGGVWLMLKGNSCLSELEKIKDLEGKIQSLPSVNGVIVQSKLLEKKESKNTEYKIELHYEYTVGGQVYMGEDEDNVLTRNKYKAEHVVDLYPVGKQIEVFYGPDQPEINFIKMREGGILATKLFWWFGWLMILFGVLLIISGIICIVIILMSRKKEIEIVH